MRDDVRAIPVLLHHAMQTANLTFDAAQALQIGGLNIRIHTHRFAAILGNFATAGRGGRQLLFLVFYWRLSHAQVNLNPRNRRLFPTTLTELKAIAALARMGLSSIPNAGYKMPAAIGMPITL